MIDHLTYQIGRTAIESLALGEFMKLLGFHEAIPGDPFEHGYLVRWFKKAGQPAVHYVSEDIPEPVNLGLGHFCVVLEPSDYQRAIYSRFIDRNSGSGRAWLRYDDARVEIRPRLGEDD